MAVGCVQRAYELASSGTVGSLTILRKRLLAERYESVDAHLSGPAIRRDLMKLMHAE